MMQSGMPYTYGDKCNPYDSVYASSMSEAEKFMQANVEALTQDEGGTSGWLHCRCHNDGHCYAGNQISFRPACIKLYGSTDCDVYRANCPSA